MYKRLFLLDLTASVGTPDIYITPSNEHQYSREIREILPVVIKSIVITTDDLVTARTYTIGHYSNDGDLLQIYDVTPNADNNTLELTPYLKVEDGATANTDATTGVLSDGWKAVRDTYVRINANDALGAGKNSQLKIVYEAVEKCSWSDAGGVTTANKHQELGISE